MSDCGVYCSFPARPPRAMCAPLSVLLIVWCIERALKFTHPSIMPRDMTHGFEPGWRWGEGLAAVCQTPTWSDARVAFPLLAVSLACGLYNKAANLFFDSVSQIWDCYWSPLSWEASILQQAWTGHQEIQKSFQSADLKKN